MKLSDFDYNLPQSLIAQQPAQPRDHSRLLTLDKISGVVSHHYFYELGQFLNSGDILVVNKSKVFPARLIGQKKTGGKVEILLNKQLDKNCWEAMGKRVKENDEIEFFNSSLKAKILKKDEKIVQVNFNLSGENFFAEVERIGLVPLPPYIKRERKNPVDSENYQTVYAQDRGSVAAPTAGLHFTDSLIKKLKNQGIEFKEVTLHVGLGTFAPVESENILEHKMHSEYYSIEKETFDSLQKAKKEGRRIIAVGTTTTRVLETVFGKFQAINNKLLDTSLETSDSELITEILSGWTDIFIYPGYDFKCIDGLITNFHLPKSSLLMLVSALAGKAKIDMAYEEAIKHNYRFYSYGDAMLII